MSFPQLNAASRINRLVNRIKATTTEQSISNAAGILNSVKGSVTRSKLKKRLGAIGSAISPPLPMTRSTQFKLPATETARLTKWTSVALNLAKMDSTILKEWKERKAQAKAKSNNKFPF
jgi:hypothetical protein